MKTVCTVGHGDRPLVELTGLLRQAGIGILVDVRRFPGSRRHPQFARAELESALREAGFDYRWEGERLGGRRRMAAGSPHTALRHAGFRAYADHMQSPDFQAAVADLLALPSEMLPAVMCAERLPWRCHRWYLADALLIAGAQVIHLIAPGQQREHRLSRYARVVDGGLIYDQQPDG